MTTLQNASSIMPPEDFTACVRQAARQAVSRTPSPRRIARPILLIAIVLAALLSIAALGGLFVSDLFTPAQGFMLPDIAWGSAPDEALPEKIQINGYTGEISYLYHQGGLTSVDITFLSPDGERNLLPRSLLDELAAECTRQFGPADQKTVIDGAALQQALREYLGYTDQKTEAERMADALQNAGADEALITKVQSSVETSQEYLMDSWIDEDTHTALSLFASYATDGNSLRQIRLSLGYLPEI